jgi:hypothetical protein
MLIAARTLFLFDMKFTSDLDEGSAELPWGRRGKDEFQIKDNFVANKVSSNLSKSILWQFN